MATPRPGNEKSLLVSESVLSMVKDNRFVMHFQELLHNFLFGIISLPHVDNNVLMSLLKLDVNAMAWFLCTLLPYWKKNRTMGMEYVELNHTKSVGNKDGTKLKNILFLLSSIIIPYTIQRIVIYSNHQDHGDGDGDNIISQLLKSIKNRIKMCYGNNCNNTSKSTKIMNNEELRGIKRQNIFHNQRAQMLQQSLRYEQLQKEQDDGEAHMFKNNIKQQEKITTSMTRDDGINILTISKQKIRHYYFLICKVCARVYFKPTSLILLDRNFLKHINPMKHY